MKTAASILATLTLTSFGMGFLWLVVWVFGGTDNTKPFWLFLVSVVLGVAWFIVEYQIETTDDMIEEEAKKRIRRGLQ